MSEKAVVILPDEARFEIIRDRGLISLLLICMRPHQWLKNLFVLTPIMFGMKLGAPGALMHALAACASFCLMSSSLYIINDIFDAPSDRNHPEKQFRPIASGALPVKVAFLGSGILLAASVWIAAWLGTSFLVLCAAYWALILGYCLGLKGVIVLDAMIIAFGFVLRVIGGAIAVDVKPTHWLIVCAFLLALYLAFAKRRQELLLLTDQATSHRPVLNSYSVDYLNQVNNILLGATIVCYALYTVAPETVARFGTDRLIYGSVFVVYGLLRYMNLLQNPSNGGDPGKLLIKDKPLLSAVFGWMVYNLAIIYNSSLESFFKH